MQMGTTGVQWGTTGTMLGITILAQPMVNCTERRMKRPTGIPVGALRIY
jgi:hypothetical protein